MGTICRKRITSPTNGLGTSCRENTSMYVHMSGEASHIAKPEPKSAQNNLALGEPFLTLERTATVAQSRMIFCRMSPQAVRANPRGTRSDTKTWTQTTRHTMAVHLRAFRSGESPTFKI